MQQLALSTTTALLLLVCVAHTSSQNGCYPTTADLLHKELCGENLDSIVEDVYSTTLPNYRKGLFAASKIKMTAFESDPGLCTVSLLPDQNVEWTVGIRYLEATGDFVVVTRWLGTTHGSFYTTASVLTCIIPSDGSGSCIIPDLDCSINGHFNISPAEMLGIGFFAKTKVRSHLKRKVEKRIEKILETELREKLGG